MPQHVHIHGLEDTVRRLRALPPELGSKGGGPIRAALFRAARLIRDQAIENAPEATGNLKAQIYMVRDGNPKAIGATEHYQLRVRTGRRSRLRFKGKFKDVQRKDAFYWRFVEFGTAKMVGKRFMTRAFEARKQDAVAEFVRVFRRGLERAEAKLSRMR